MYTMKHLLHRRLICPTITPCLGRLMGILDVQMARCVLSKILERLVQFLHDVGEFLDNC